jgi:hypothetical protein
MGMAPHPEGAADMKLTLRMAAIAACAFASAALLSPKAEAGPRVYIFGGNPYATNAGLPWYAVRAYYFGGPWSGAAPYPYSYAGWSDYAGRNGIGCTPGTPIKGGDGIMYMCQ